MKLSSKVLAGSLASAGMVLSLVAPALTAQAATTTGKVDDNGNVTGLATAEDAAKKTEEPAVEEKTPVVEEKVAEPWL